jgi:hypothetical protein
MHIGRVKVCITASPLPFGTVLATFTAQVFYESRLRRRPMFFDDSSDFLNMSLTRLRGWGDYPSYNLAKTSIEFSVTIPRKQLRPGYGKGFAGAPINTHIVSDDGITGLSIGGKEP